MVQYAAELLLDVAMPYNPLVFYGPTGIGKSLLAIGLADRWRHKYPQSLAIITNGSDFARSFANAVDTNNLPAFRKKSRASRLFVLDDAHLMQPKRAAQEELARLIDVLLEQCSAVLVTTNRAPCDEDRLLPALRSRLAGGLAVPLNAPGISARRLLLRRFAEQQSVEFTDEAIDLLSHGIQDHDSERITVPQLNHAVAQLGHAARIEEQIVDVYRVRHYLNHQLTSSRPTMPAIVSLVAKYFSIPVQHLRGSSRRQHVVRARGVAIYLARSLTGESLEKLGQYLGNRDHTTVLHACRKIESLRSTDPAIGKALEELLEKLRAP